MKFIGIEPLFDLSVTKYLIEDIDKEAVTHEILDNYTRISTNYLDTHYEDANFEPKEAGTILIDKIAEALEDYKINNYWAHVHQPLEQANWHDHVDEYGDNDISWCYYLKVPEGAGSIVYRVHKSVPYKEIKPVEGMLLVFPSWIEHMVTKNMSKDIRISIAGNAYKI